MQLLFAKENKDIFEMIKSGQKSVETRAATQRYKSIIPGDVLTFVCEGDSFKKTVTKTKVFPSIHSLLERYQPKEINPKLETAGEINAMYQSFPGYEAKIKEHGILAIEVK